MKKVKILFLCGLFIAGLTGCSSFLNKNDDEEQFPYEIKAIVNTSLSAYEGAVPSSMTSDDSSVSTNLDRSAFPAEPTGIENEWKCYITATKYSDAAATTQVSPAVTLNGTEDAEGNFLIRLTEGYWRVNATVKDSDAANAKTIYSGTSDPVNINSDAPSAEVQVNVTPNMTESGSTPGSGNVSLELTTQANSTITKAYAVWYKATATNSISTTPSYIDTITFTSNTATLERNNVSSGKYKVDFKFYSGTGTAEYLSYSISESINVFDNLTTNTWKRTNASCTYINADGVFCVPNNSVAKFTGTDFYVKSNGKDTNPSSLTTGTIQYLLGAGKSNSPFKTVQKAVDVIKALNAASSSSPTYTIHIIDDITDDSSSYTEANNYALINLDTGSDSSAKTLNLKITSSDSTVKKIDARRSSSQTGRVMYIGSKVKVTLSNVALTGGYLADSSTNTFNGAGIEIVSSANNELAVEGKVAVFENTKRPSGSSTAVANNVYLPSYTSGSNTVQKTIRITGPMAQYEDSSTVRKIGITAQIKPNNASKILNFTDNFDTAVTATPSMLFTSDENYMIGVQSITGSGSTSDRHEACFAISGVTISPSIAENVVISLKKGTASYGSGWTTLNYNGNTLASGVLNVSAEKLVENAASVTLTDSNSTWYVYTTYYGETQTAFTWNSTDKTVTYAANAPRGLYQIYVQINHNGASYSAYFDVEVL